MTAVAFACSICGDPSTQICVYCTKDACGNHLCAKCGRCSDCCECVLPLEEPAPAQAEQVTASPEPTGEEPAAAAEAIESSEVPEDPEAPIAEDVVDPQEEDALKPDTPPEPASS